VNVYFKYLTQFVARIIKILLKILEIDPWVRLNYQLPQHDHDIKLGLHDVAHYQ
jgi:hypothetical protein